MAAAAPSRLKRIRIAFSSFRRALRDPEFAGAVHHLAGHGPAPAAEPPVQRPSAPLASAAPDSALILLGLLQREGRLVDFLHEDIRSYSDQEIGAAARIVHQGCRRVVEEHLQIAPIHADPEGSRVTLPLGFDAASIRPTGNVVGDPPFTGTLVHRGWRVEAVRLPQTASGHDARVIAAAEVEL